MSALFNASKWRELVTIVSLLLKAPLLTKEVNSSSRVVIPIFSLAERRRISLTLVVISFLCFSGKESILLAINNSRLFGKRFLIVSISSRKVLLEPTNLLESIRKISS